MDGRAEHLLRCEHLEQQADAGHIGKRIERADLVEVDLVNGHAVYAAFRVRNGAVDGKDILAHGLGERKVRNAVLDLVQAGVRMLVLVVMRMPVRVRMCGAFFLAVHQHAHMRPGDAAFDRRFGRKRDAGKTERVHFSRNASFSGSSS